MKPFVAEMATPATLEPMFRYTPAPMVPTIEMPPD
jgi:hypothetical protein